MGASDHESRNYKQGQFKNMDSDNDRKIAEEIEDSEEIKKSEEIEKGEEKETEEEKEKRRLEDEALWNPAPPPFELSEEEIIKWRKKYYSEEGMREEKEKKEKEKKEKDERDKKEKEKIDN